MPKKTIEQMYNEKQQRIDKAIDMKNRSIAYFNSVNAAISVVGIEKGLWEQSEGEQKRESLIKWRDWFYNEWKEWFLKETTPQPVDLDKAEKQGEEFKKNVLEAERIEVDSKLEDINKEAQLGAEEIPVIEE